MKLKPMQTELPKYFNQTHDGRFRYEVYVDEDMHWALVALAAGNRMHHEEYAEQILTEYAQLALDREAQSGGEG